VQVAFSDTPTRFEQELLPFPCPAATEAPCDGAEFNAFDIVQHYNVRASRNGFIRLLFIAHFNIEEK
jgi:hypothetical protein